MKYLLIVLLSVSALLAQPNGRTGGSMEPGKISGKLIDEKTQRPVEYGNFVLYKFQDSTVATGGISDTKGEFRIDPVPFGKYFAKVSFIGYSTKVIDNVLVTPRNNDIDLGTISLVPSGIKLDEVTVKSDREAYVNNLDKKVINVDKMTTAAGGTAVDIMQNVPAVSVDASGNVSMRGSSNLTILIDGKPSSLQGLSASDVLAQIPASSIESIEIVTNPSAKYDPEGTGGIINIILKKKSNQGLNGVFTANVGTEDKYNSTVNLNYRVMPFNIFASFDSRWNNFGMSMDNNRTTTVNSAEYKLIQNQTGRNKMKNITGTFGFDYYAADKTTLSLSVQTRNMSFDNRGATNNLSYSALTLNQAFQRNNDADRGIDATDYTFSYKQNFETKGEELTADVIYSDMEMHRDEAIAQFPTASVGSMYSYKQKNVSHNTNKAVTVQSNYILPFGKTARFEGGFKLTSRDLKNNNDYSLLNTVTGAYDALPLLQNYAENKERVYGIYGIYTGTLDKFKYQLGFRGEQASQQGKLLNTGESFDNKYLTLYPTLHAGYTFSDYADVLLSYSRRVDRPSNRQLNPFIDYTDSLNIIAGNPKLKPQFINSLELNGTFQVLFTTIMPSVYYRYTDDLISIVTSLRPNNITYSTFENIAKSSTMGVDLNIMQPLAMWWRLNLGFSGYRLVIKDSPVLSDNVDNTTWNLKFSSNMNLASDLSFQIMGMYMAPAIGSNMGGFGGGGGPSALAQTKLKAIYSVDAAVKKDFFEGRLAVTLRVSDIFNTRKFDAETRSANLFYITNRKMDSRMAFLGITYRLDAKQFKQRERDVKGEGGDDL